MNKIALITGGSSGIGLELAKLFARDGYDLIIVAKDESKTNLAAQDLMSIKHAKVRTIIKDLSKQQSAQEVYEDVKSHEGRIDVLVNDAGFGTYGLFTDIPDQDDFNMVEVNVATVTKLCKFFAKDMKEQGSGKILNVASTAAFQPGPLMAVYYATKAYVLSFTAALHKELAPFGITVTALCPGPTKTHFNENASMEKSALFQGRTMNASDVAKLGFDGLMEGRAIVIPGFVNKFYAFLTRFVPISVAASFARSAQRKI